jgi:F-type H+-transporting ATPase subunit gamma
MPSLKALKTRITAVKSTQKITKAMKMVAASKLKRAQQRAEESRPYSNKIQNVIQNLSESISANSRPELLGGRRNPDGSQKNDVVLLIITGADRGLCGAFNSSIIRAAKIKINNLLDQGKTVKIVTVGKKPKEVLKTSHSKFIIRSFDAAIGKQVQFEEADEVARFAIDQFQTGAVDSVEIVYNKFINPLIQQVTFQSLIPLQMNESANDNKNTSTNTSTSTNTNTSYEYEPDEEMILKALLPQNISVQIFKTFLENSASEQGSRMTAMDNATKNAGEMIQKLSLVYNRTRQATITKELIEIISGAEAL